MNSATDATVIVSVVVGAFGMWQIVYSKRSERRLMEYQTKVHQDNTDDHNGTIGKIDVLIAKQAELHGNHKELLDSQRNIHIDVMSVKEDLRAVKADVRSLHEASRQHDKRIDDLEDRP